MRIKELKVKQIYRIKNWVVVIGIFNSVFGVEFNARAGGLDKSTGSFGQFSPKAFVEAPNPWKVYRFSGPHSKMNFPCDSMGNACTREKNYGVFDVVAQKRKSSIDVGVGTPMGDISRRKSGTETKIEIKLPNNLAVARIDGTSASSRLGFDAASSLTMSINEGLYGGNFTLGHVEGKDAAWARINPHSFYFHQNDQSYLGLTIVEKQMLLGQVRNFLNKTPMTQNLREGTYWCLSDEWKVSRSTIEKIFSNDEFDIDKCKGQALLSSNTKHFLTEKVGSIEGISSTAQHYFLNRADSIVKVQEPNLSYHISTNTEWFCPFDCDGSQYSISMNSVQTKPVVKISSDKWNFQSSSKFKLKVVRFNKKGVDVTSHLSSLTLKQLAEEARNYQDVVAVLISEITDSQGNGFSNGQWTQHTYVMLPPTFNNDNIPENFKNIEDGRVIYNLKLLDGILAMMPDQIQYSPELFDVEEKLDELILFLALKQGLAKNKPIKEIITAHRLFDIYMPTDPTSAINWKNGGDGPGQDAGKINWILNQLKE